MVLVELLCKATCQAMLHWSGCIREKSKVMLAACSKLLDSRIRLGKHTHTTQHNTAVNRSCGGKYQSSGRCMDNSSTALLLPPPNQPSVCDVVVNTYQLKISKSSPRKNILTCKIKSLKIDQVLFKKRKKSKQNMAIIKKRYTLKYKNSVLNHAATLHICTITTRRRKENLQTRKQWAAS